MSITRLAQVLGNLAIIPSSAPKRASVAIVLRPCPDEATAMQILFIRRAQNDRDAWSGQVAFPGGRQQFEDGKNDLETAIRETREELGLSLDSPDFELLGRLPDRPVTAKGGIVPGMAVCPFIFVQRALKTPKLVLNPAEVGAVCWAHENCLVHDRVEFTVERPYSPLPPRIARCIPPSILQTLGLASVSFPAVELSETAPLSAVHESNSVTAGANIKASTFQLWGLTLGITSDLLVLKGNRPLDQPPIRAHNRVVRFATSLFLAAHRSFL